MKQSLFILALTCLGSQYAHATTAADVCTVIANRNSDNGPVCAQIISQNRFQDSILDTCLTTANSDTNNAITCMRAAANTYFDSGAIDTCKIVAARNTDNVGPCLQAAANKSYLNGAARVCVTLANSDTSRAVECLKNSGVIGANPSCPTTRAIKSSLNSALDSIYNGRGRYAARILEDLLSQLDGCDQ